MGFTKLHNKNINNVHRKPLECPGSALTLSGSVLGRGGEGGAGREYPLGLRMVGSRGERV